MLRVTLLGAYFVLAASVLTGVAPPTDIPGMLREAADIRDASARLKRYDEIAASLKPRSETVKLGNSGAWRVNKTVSPLDDKVIVSLSLDADSPIDAWPGTHAAPRLVIRFQEGKLDCYLDLRAQPNVEQGQGTTITLRFDKFEAAEFKMDKSTDGEAVFFRDAKEIVRKMAGAQTMVLRFTPFHSAPVTTTFSLTGITTALKPLEDASGIQITPEAPVSLGEDAVNKALARIHEGSQAHVHLHSRVEGTRFIFGADGANEISHDSVGRDLTDVLIAVRVELEKHPEWRVELTANGSTYCEKGTFGLPFKTPELDALTRDAVKRAGLPDGKCSIKPGADVEPSFFGDDPQYPSLKGKLRSGNDHVIIAIVGY